MSAKARLEAEEAMVSQEVVTEEVEWGLVAEEQQPGDECKSRFRMGPGRSETPGHQ